MGSSNSKVSDDLSELEVAVRSFYQKLKDALDKQSDAVKNFLYEYRLWAAKRDEVILSLTELVCEIQKHHRNANIASLAGSSVSLVSGAACVAGIVLAPFTGGLSTVLTAGGLLGSSAGTLTMTGAKVVEFGLKREILKKVNAAVEADCQETLCLTSYIDNCQKNQTELEKLLRDNRCIEYIRGNSDLLNEILTHPVAKASLDRINHGSQSVDDYVNLMSYCRSENRSLLMKLKEMRSVKLDASVFQRSHRVYLTLKSSVTNVKQCLIILKSWRNGVSTARLASKASRFSKGALLGVSMAVDLYDIGSTAKEMFLKEELEDVKNLMKVINDLQQQKNEVSEYFEILHEAFESYHD